MVLRPERMRRMMIIASRSQQAAIIQTLHDAKAVDIIDHEAGRPGLLHDFSIGTPLPEAGPASERLVRVRALLRHLDLEGAEASRPVSVRELEQVLDERLHGVESQANAALERREAVRAQLAEGHDVEAKLQPLTALPVPLEDYRGYESLQVFVGRAAAEGPRGINAISPDALVVTSQDEVFAAFVPKAQAAAVSDHLYRHGYAEIEVPAGSGMPADQIARIQQQRGSLEQQLAQSDATLAQLASEHRDFLLAAEEHLHIQVEKAEAPLAFAATENAFVLDAWVPAKAYDDVVNRLHRATHDAVHVEEIEVDLHALEHDDGHHAPGHGVDAQTSAHDESLRVVAPPTKYDNPAGIRRFQWFVDLFSTPNYGEVDPTAIFAIAFPLFFGFMIGDLGLGLIMIGLGWLLARKLPRVDGMKQLGTAFMIAGVVAAIFGGVVFQDALGIPLTHNEEMLAEHGLTEASTCQQLFDAAHEATWTCLFSSRSAELGTLAHVEPLIHKVTDVQTMLLISVFAAGIHLLVGMILGVRNQIGHGAKHVGAKVGFLILLLSFYPAVIALLRPDSFIGYVATEAGEHHTAINMHLPITVGQAYLIAAGGFVLGGAILAWAEGFAGVLEIPSVLSAILSYLRLGAVAIAKGAMAVAFNALTLVAIGLSPGAGIGLLVLGLIVFLLVQTLLFVLGMLSAGIQALRLNFVEFFTKFYKGGGKPYKPFGRQRVVTVESSST